jgi:hypothetical protein
VRFWRCREWQAVEREGSDFRPCAACVEISREEFLVEEREELRANVQAAVDAYLERVRELEL